MARTKGTWGTVREVPRKGSGRYQASYVHGGVWGVQKGVRFTAPQTFETKGDAWAWIDRERRLIERDEWTPPYERIRAQQDERARIEAARQAAEAIPTIASYGAEYVKRDDLSGGTRQRYAQLLKFYIVGEPATITRRGMVKGQPVVHHGIGDIRITELTRSRVRTWWRGLPVKTRESSSRQSYDLLRAILNAAVEEELIDVNPVRIKDAASAKASRERDQDPLPFDILYRVADAMPAPWRLGVLLGGVLGLRSGEVRALQRRDFTLTGEVPLLKVHQAVKEDEGKLEIGPLKTARKGVASRTLVIPAALLPDVKAHLRDHTQLGRTVAAVGGLDHDPVPSRQQVWDACGHEDRCLCRRLQPLLRRSGHLWTRHPWLAMAGCQGACPGSHQFAVGLGWILRPPRRVLHRPHQVWGRPNKPARSRHLPACAHQVRRRRPR